MSEARFTDDLRASAPEWERLQRHPFFAAVEADALPREAFLRYLRIEGGFVDTAVRIFAHALTKAPDPAAQRHLVRVLAGLTGDQFAFFAEAFASFGVPGEPWREPPPPRAGMLAEGMLGIAAAGEYGEVLAAMLAAEWTYLTACERALLRPPSDPMLRRWLELHVEQDFRDQVAWLRASLDGIAAGSTERRRARLRSVFRTALELEFHFHSLPLEALSA